MSDELEVSSSIQGRRVLCVDDHPLFRAGLVAAWRRWRVADLVSEAATWTEAMEVAQTGVDIAVVDLVLPDGSGLVLAEELVRRGAALVVVLSSFDSPAIVEACRRVGARGFFSKEIAVPKLFSEIERLMSVPQVASFPAVGPLPSLTPRELDVLACLLEGRQNPSIASHLGVSIETVKSHVSSLIASFDAQDRVAAAEKARRLGFGLALPHLRDDGTR